MDQLDLRLPGWLVLDANAGDNMGSTGNTVYMKYVSGVESGNTPAQALLAALQACGESEVICLMGSGLVPLSCSLTELRSFSEFEASLMNWWLGQVDAVESPLTLENRIWNDLKNKVSECILDDSIVASSMTIAELSIKFQASVQSVSKAVFKLLREEEICPYGSDGGFIFNTNRCSESSEKTSEGGCSKSSRVLVGEVRSKVVDGRSIGLFDVLYKMGDSAKRLLCSTSFPINMRSVQVKVASRREAAIHRANGGHQMLPPPASRGHILRTPGNQTEPRGPHTPLERK